VKRLGARVASTDLSSKEKVRLITELGDDISAAAISYAGKDAMHTQLKGIKKKIDGLLHQGRCREGPEGEQ
jgi:phage host-nuclease inhibitor protein Gam